MTEVIITNFRNSMKARVVVLVVGEGQMKEREPLSIIIFDIK